MGEPSHSSLCADGRPLPLCRAGPVVLGPSQQVATGQLQVPLVSGQDPDAVFFGAEAERVQLLQLNVTETRRQGLEAGEKAIHGALELFFATWKAESLHSLCNKQHVVHLTFENYSEAAYFLFKTGFC